MNPLFSIITITFNAEQVLPPTLDSVKRQSFTNFEHLVVDGASTDGTVEIAERSGIKGISVVSEPDRGLYDAMNKGIRRAKGEYLIFLNAGDAFHAPSSLQEIADAIEQGAQPDIVYGQTQIVDADRNFVAMRHLTAGASDVRQLQARHAGVPSGVCGAPRAGGTLRPALSVLRRLRMVSALLEKSEALRLYRHNAYRLSC